MNFPLLTDEQIDAEVFPTGMAVRSVLSGPAEIRRYARAVESATRAPLLAEIERLRDELALCCELKREYQDQLAAAREDAERRVDAERERCAKIAAWLQWCLDNCDDSPEWNFGTEATHHMRELLAGRDAPNARTNTEAEPARPAERTP